MPLCISPSFSCRGRHDMVAMLPAVRGDVGPATGSGAAEKLLHGHGKCKKKAPRKIHKAKREKHKGDLLNDLFGELGEMLAIALSMEALLPCYISMVTAPATATR